MLSVLVLTSLGLAGPGWSWLVLGLLPVGGSAWELRLGPQGQWSWLHPSRPGGLDGQGPLGTAISDVGPSLLLCCDRHSLPVQGPSNWDNVGD